MNLGFLWVSFVILLATGFNTAIKLDNAELQIKQLKSSLSDCRQIDKKPI